MKAMIGLLCNFNKYIVFILGTVVNITDSVYLQQFDP